MAGSLAHKEWHRHRVSKERQSNQHRAPGAQRRQYSRQIQAQANDCAYLWCQVLELQTLEETEVAAKALDLLAGDHALAQLAAEADGHVGHRLNTTCDEAFAQYCEKGRPKSKNLSDHSSDEIVK